MISLGEGAQRFSSRSFEVFSCGHVRYLAVCVLTLCRSFTVYLYGVSMYLQENRPSARSLLLWSKLLRSYPSLLILFCQLPAVPVAWGACTLDATVP